MSFGFDIGDVVRLKSGGPEMTVEETKDDHPDWMNASFTYVTCVWYESGHIKRETFKHELLKKIRDRHS